MPVRKTYFGDVARTQKGQTSALAKTESSSRVTKSGFLLRREAYRKHKRPKAGGTATVNNNHESHDVYYHPFPPGLYGNETSELHLDALTPNTILQKENIESQVGIYTEQLKCRCSIDKIA
jgi:hypothetical protein